MKLRAFSTVPLYLTAFLVLLTGCNRSETSSSPLDQSTAKTFPVETVRAVFEQVEHSLEAVGSLLPEDEVTVGAGVAGIIKKRYVDEGDTVNKHQLLFEIEDLPFRLKVTETDAQLQEALARLKNAKAILQRKNRLYKDAIIGQHDFEDARTQVSLNKAITEKLRAGLNQAKGSLRNSSIYAPLEGIISERITSAGEYVKVGADMVKIVNISSLKVEFSLPEKNAGRVKGGQKVTVTTRAYPGVPFEGSIYFINPKVDRETRSIKVKARLDNRDRQLKPGFFVNATLLFDSTRELVLPESAVIVREGRVLVMTVVDNKIIYKKVSTGVRFNGKVEILDGITPEDVIVLSGSNEITEGTLVKVVPEKSEDK